MLRRMKRMPALAAAVLVTGVAWAQNQEPVYGSPLMTQQERNEYQTRWRAAKTAEERERIRQENHERMEERARQRGVTLPSEPPAMPGRGAGMGPGPGGGMGPGGGGRR